jgi:hypothetical protein
MNYTLISVMVCAALFFMMSLVSGAAYRLGGRRHGKDEKASEVTGLVSGAVFSLLGLLIAFTFYGAFSRLDVRRQLIVQEANAIGTAYLRLDLLPVDAQGPLREKFREYTESRAVLYEKIIDVPAALAELAAAAELQKEIWALGVAATNSPKYNTARMLLMPALNEMIDIVTTRTVAIQTHPPVLIFLTLCALAVVCAWITGYRAGVAGQPVYLYMIAFAGITAFILYVILDIEHVRYGLIRLHEVNQLLFDLAETMR